jgi:hypothetical protein
MGRPPLDGPGDALITMRAGGQRRPILIAAQLLLRARQEPARLAAARADQRQRNRESDG